MIYLNDVESGGETEFIELQHSIKPSRGMAVIWSNQNNDGSVNPNTLHRAKPVVRGYKAIITKWFREGNPISDAIFNKSINEKLPAYTENGFYKIKIPTQLYKKIALFYQKYKGSKSKENESVVVNNQRSPSALVDLPELLRNEIHNAIQPIAEAWSGILLASTYVYGIREYYAGSVLKPHRDRPKTHIISAILNISQDVKEAWPLQIEDHYCRQHELLMSPGDMVLYEGGRLKHSRNTPFCGEHYANVFVHYISQGSNEQTD